MCIPDGLVFFYVVMLLRRCCCRCRRRNSTAVAILFGILLILWILTYSQIRSPNHGQPEKPIAKRKLPSILSTVQSPNHGQPEKPIAKRKLPSVSPTLNANHTAAGHSVDGLIRPTDLANRFPRFMIIGFGKSGTRALYDLLRMHPKLNGPMSEMRFFSALNYSQETLKTKYLLHIPRPPMEGYTIEKSPDYITSPGAPIRIAKSAKKLGVETPKLKFIVVLRDPVDRAMSEYLEWVALRNRNNGPALPSFEDMVWDENSPGSIDGSQPFLNASCYAQHIQRWFKTFSREQCCFVDGDTFTKQPYQEVSKLEECMGLPHFFEKEYFIYNHSRKLYCFKVPKKKMKCGKNSKGREHPDIPREVLEKLREYFHPWNVQLSELMGPSWRSYDH